VHDMRVFDKVVRGFSLVRHDPEGSHYDWFEIICNSVVRGFSLVHDPEGSHYIRK